MVRVRVKDGSKVGVGIGVKVRVQVKVRVKGEVRVRGDVSSGMARCHCGEQGIPQWQPRRILRRA